MRSIFALDNKDFSKHSGVAANFRKDYIKTEIFDVIYSDMIKAAFYIRNNSDYDDFYVVSRAEVNEQIENAKSFCEAIKVYLITKGVEIDKIETTYQI